jgi:hypothetical protein
LYRSAPERDAGKGRSAADAGHDTAIAGASEKDCANGRTAGHTCGADGIALGTRAVFVPVPSASVHTSLIKPCAAVVSHALSRGYRRDVDSTDLTDEHRERLHTTIDRQRQYLARLVARMKEAGFPESDSLHFYAWRALLAAQDLTLALNDGRRKGLAHRYQKRAKDWPKR